MNHYIGRNNLVFLTEKLIKFCLEIKKVESAASNGDLSEYDLENDIGIFAAN